MSKVHVSDIANAAASDLFAPIEYKMRIVDIPVIQAFKGIEQASTVVLRLVTHLPRWSGNIEICDFNLYKHTNRSTGQSNLLLNR